MPKKSQRSKVAEPHGDRSLPKIRMPGPLNRSFKVLGLLLPARRVRGFLTGTASTVRLAQIPMSSTMGIHPKTTRLSCPAQSRFAIEKAGRSQPLDLMGGEYHGELKEHGLQIQTSFFSTLLSLPPFCDPV